MISVAKIKGFTLLEVMVVLVIMALVLVIIPPFLPNVMANTNVKGAARELAANLKHARSQAIDHQQETTLLVNVDRKNYTLNDKTKILTLPDETFFSIVTAKSEQLSEVEGQIRFFPDGSSTGGQIKFVYAKHEYTIYVHWLTGKVRIEP